MVTKSNGKTNGNGSGAANHIEAWRKFRGFKYQGDLAEASGITRATISRLESGALPYRQWVLEKIALALDCTPADLIGVDPNAPGTIFRIYGSIPAKHRTQALSMLDAFAASIAVKKAKKSPRAARR